MRAMWILWLILFSSSSFAQEALTYQKPDQAILDLVDVKLAPYTLMDDANENIVFLYRDPYKSIEVLSKEELRLAGLRIDPKTNIGSRVNYFNEVKLKRVGSNDIIAVKGLPEKPRLTNFSWSPDQRYIALTNTTDEGVELWLLDINKAQAKPLSKATVNANMGSVINWFADNKSVLVKMIPNDRKPLIDSKKVAPIGPTISVSDGKRAQNRTYQDLLKNKNDELNFEQLARSELIKIDLNGQQTPWRKAEMFGSVNFSPDGSKVLITQYAKPFSYLVPYSRFPKSETVYSNRGDKVATIVEVPLIEDLPKGFMAVREGRRNIQWRDDKPHTLVYVEALDSGDPAVEVEHRDQLMQLEMPYTGEAKKLFSSINRMYSVQWGDDQNAIANDYWWNNRNQKTYWFNPSNPEQQSTMLHDRNYQDMYSDPGSFVEHRNQYGRNVLDLKDGSVFLIGEGYSDKGQFPFVDKFDLKTQTKTRLYQSAYVNKLEDIRGFEPDNNRLLVRVESKNEYPNYYFRNLDNQVLTQLTSFDNPFKSIQNVEKQVIQYQRADGVELSGTLYLPTDYQEGKKYPMILWAYPREYKDKSSAGQNTQNKNEFTYPYYGSPLYWVTKGYVVLDDAAFPIVGEDQLQPNDSFRAQLVANAKAAIDAVDQRGLIDTQRVAVGGHSYGAFMVANLLSHSDLFAAGIARSGAYNRTLTPFGFQSEERSYWEAPDVYNTMSPFMHADKMKTPLLLIHGEADNNSGTYPLQSERYFNALKGLGATTRLVMLPKESHGYRAKESILHMLWEQDQWLEKYVMQKQSTN